ncbi:MAG TPA: cyclic nucleotide-binding domain-containing protein, partial [Acidimicrobiales bacterium]|nr:cyclic nucleotide-binding domain-containing protein [Acidimicrobiales bacterium]
MRIEGSVTVISWIPSEAIGGLSRLPFDLGTFHYDEPPPDDLSALGPDPIAELGATDRFRVANELKAWIDVEEGRIVGAEYVGGGRIGSTRLRFGPARWNVLATLLPDVQAEPVVDIDHVTFVQTAGGRTGVPFPRPVRHAPFVQYRAPIAWSTLRLVVHLDGRIEGELIGASKFPRHWVYDAAGKLVAKSGTTASKNWASHAFGKHTPWGDTDSPAFVTAAESALERQLSTQIMRGGATPRFAKVAKGKTLCEQGDPGADVFLLLDGVLTVEVDGEQIAEVGPGAILGERAYLEAGTRTSTLRAHTPCRVAVASADQI